MSFKVARVNEPSDYRPCIIGVVTIVPLARVVRLDESERATLNAVTRENGRYCEGIVACPGRTWMLVSLGILSLLVCNPGRG